MADDVLSQAELEALLTTSASRAKPKRAAAQGQLLRVDLVASDRVEPPRGATREQLGALAEMHEEFARRLGAVLSTTLRTAVEVKVAAVEPLCYGEFQRGLESPSYINVLRAAPLAGEVVLDINLSLLFPMIDRLLGGGREPGPIDRRPLSDIELRLAARVANLVLEELGNTWRRVGEVQFSVERVESDPRAAQIALPHEVVVRLAFEVAMQHAAGIVSLCLSGAAMRSIAERLSGSRPPATLAAAGASTVEVVAQLAETRISTADLGGLRSGDIIKTDRRVDSPLVICVEGVPKFLARPGTFEGRKAVQIDGPVDAPADGDS